MSGERDDLHSKFSKSVLELREKAALKSAVLEQQIHAIRKELVSIWLNLDNKFRFDYLFWSLLYRRM